MNDRQEIRPDNPRRGRHSRAYREEISIPPPSDTDAPTSATGVERRPPAEQAHRMSDSVAGFFHWPTGNNARKWAIAIVVILAVLSVLLIADAVRDTSNQPTTTADRDPVPEDDEAESPQGPVPNGDFSNLKVGELPPGAPITEEDSGKYRTVGHAGERFGSSGKVFTYTVEIEDTIDSATFGGDDAFAAMIDSTLANPKGWTRDGKFSFQHVAEKDLPENKKPDLRIQLTSHKSTQQMCGNDFKLETSCFWSDGNRVILNEARWIRGAIPFDGDLGQYRQYLINHEVGHGLGFKDHQACPADGRLAPVMMQQTVSVDNKVLEEISQEDTYADNDAVCRPNAWPYPLAEH